jgi:hypothetical protein
VVSSGGRGRGCGIEGIVYNSNWTVTGKLNSVGHREYAMVRDDMTSCPVYVVVINRPCDVVAKYAATKSSKFGIQGPPPCNMYRTGEEA